MADTKQIIATAKKNWVIIASAAVAAVSVAVAILIPPGKLAATETEIASRKSVGNEVDSLLRKPRKLPNVNLDVAEAPDLKGFPNREAVHAAEEALKQFKGQSDAVVAEMDGLGNHKLLVRGAFAGGRLSQASAFKFRDDYLAYMPAGLNAIANAGAPPTPEEISQAINDEKTRIQNTLPIRGAGGSVINQDEVQAALVRAETEVPQKLKEDVAARHAVYVNRDTWARYAAMDPASGTTPRDQDVWFAQVGLWVQQDVAAAIAAANKGSASVASSPVKHLVKVTLPAMPYLVTKDAAGAVAVTGINPAGTITLNKLYSLTGHVPGPMYDVVKYGLIVRVAESRVAEFLAEIPRDRLHYVTGVDMRAVDANVESSLSGLAYGGDPVVELSVEVEALFLRKAFENTMPKSVKQMIGVEAATAVTP